MCVASSKYTTADWVRSLPPNKEVAELIVVRHFSCRRQPNLEAVEFDPSLPSLGFLEYKYLCSEACCEVVEILALGSVPN